MKNPVLLLISSLYVCHSALGDVIYLKNGDQITGIIKEGDFGEISIKPTYSDNIEIDIAEIRSLKSDTMLKLRLSGGQDGEYQFLGESDGGKTLLKSNNAEIAVSLTDLKKVEKINTGFEWDVKIDISEAVSRGNTNSLTSNLNMSFNTRFNRHRALVDFSSVLEKKESDTIKEGDRINFSYNYLYGSDWFFAINSTIERDPIALLDRRVSLNPSIGYDIWDEANKSLNVQLGAGYQTEQIDDDSSSGALIDWRLRYEHEFQRGNIELFHNHEIYRNLEGRENLVFNSATGIRFEITDDIYLNVQLNYDIDSEPVQGTDNEDLTLLFGAGIKI